MKRIAITYPFLWWQRKVAGHFAEKWEELTPVQLVAVCRMLADKTSEEEFLSTLSGIRKRIVKRLSPFQRFKLAELIGFIGDPKPYHQFIVPYVKEGWLKLHAPEPKLKGVTFGQFIFADTYFAMWQEKQDPVLLNKFVASWYLPKNRPFSESHVDGIHKYFYRVDDATKEAIAMNYQLIREWLAKAYPLVFVQKTEKESKKKQPKGNGWIDVFDSIVGDDIVNQDRYADLPVHNVFRLLTKRIKANAKGN